MKSKNNQHAKHPKQNTHMDNEKKTNKNKTNPLNRKKQNKKTPKQLPSPARDEMSIPGGLFDL